MRDCGPDKEKEETTTRNKAAREERRKAKKEEGRGGKEEEITQNKIVIHPKEFFVIIHIHLGKHVNILSFYQFSSYLMIFNFLPV